MRIPTNKMMRSPSTDRVIRPMGLQAPEQEARQWAGRILLHRYQTKRGEKKHAPRERNPRGRWSRSYLGILPLASFIVAGGALALPLPRLRARLGHAMRLARLLYAGIRRSHGARLAVALLVGVLRRRGLGGGS